MISQAKLHYLKITPRKVRLVADLIRGKKVEEAQNILRFTQKRATLPLLKLLNQAISNAVNNNSGIDENNVFITKIFVDGGPVAKRRFLMLDEINKAVKDVTKSKKIKAVKNKKQVRKIKSKKKGIEKENKSKKVKKTVSKKVKSASKKK